MIFYILAAIVVALANLIHRIFVVTVFNKTTYHKLTKNSYYSTVFNKGKHGEYLIFKELQKYEKEGGRFLFNVYLPKEDGGTTEADVILLCHNGIFVFESKNYSGWIFGNSSQKTWTQTLPKGSGQKAQKEHFLNPVWQNKLHIKYLSSFLENDPPVYSVIVFSDRCTLKNVSVTEEEIKVINRYKLENTVKEFYERKARHLSDYELNRLYNALLPLSQVSEEVKQKHIEDIRQSKFPEAEKKELSVFPESSPEKTPEEPVPQVETPDTKICPLCGSPMVLRTASRGQYAGNRFYGCSNYPKCKGIINLNKQ